MSFDQCFDRLQFIVNRIEAEGRESRDASLQAIARILISPQFSLLLSSEMSGIRLPVCLIYARWPSLFVARCTEVFEGFKVSRF